MDKHRNNEDFKACVAKLESQVDHLDTELTYLNSLLIRVGFPNGIETLKATAKELLAEVSLSSHEKHLKGS